jgi:hypothetical protein
MPLAILCLLALQMKGWWLPGPDATAYLSISRNMAAGTLACLGSPHLRYAPGYPALIAPTWWLSDSPFWLISLVHLALAAALAAGVYAWARRLQPELAILIAALVLANTSLWEAFRRTHTELAFTTELVWAAVCLQRAADAPNWRALAGWAGIGVVLATAATLTRHVGVMLVPGFALMLAVRAWRGEMSGRRAAALTALVGAPVVAAVLALVAWDRHRAVHVGPDAKSYAEDLRDRSFTPLEQVAEGVRLRIAECGRLLIPGMVKCYARTGQWLNANSLIYLSLTPLLILGWLRLARRRPDALVFALPLHTALYVIWPFDQATRFMLPMLPVLWTAAAEAMVADQRRSRLLAMLTAAHLLVSVFYWVHSTWNSSYAADWKHLAVLSEQTTADREATATWDLDELRCDMLRLQLDRAVLRCDCPQELSGDTRWLIAPAGSTLPRGFVQHSSSGPFALWERTGDSRLARTAKSDH